MNQARIRTCTRDPLFRLFYVGIALILRNAWVWFHLTIFLQSRGRQLRPHLEQLRFPTMLLCLQRVAEVTLRCQDPLDHTIPVPSMTRDHATARSPTQNY